MARRKPVKFTNKRHSEWAIMSFILGVISLLSIGTVLYLSYLRMGNVPGGYGVSGLLAAVFALAGLILGIVTAREKDRYHVFCWLGIFCNAVALIILALLVCIGVGLI